jgi:hypothetical protein
MRTFLFSLLALPCFAQAAATTYAEVRWEDVAISTTGSLVASLLMDTEGGYPEHFNSLITVDGNTLNGEPLVSYSNAFQTATLVNNGDSMSSSLSSSHPAWGLTGFSHTHGQLSLSGAGTLTMTVPYTLSITAIEGWHSVAYLRASIQELGLSDIHRASLDPLRLTDTYGSPFQQGLLTFNFSSAGDRTLTVMGVTDTQIQAAPVPEPETYALMLMGGTFLLFARKRKAQRL